jgi:ribonuclease HI
MINLNHKHMINVLNVFTDGGARGNPGPAATGVYIADENNKQVGGFGKLLGVATNNVAEYKAVIQALDWVIENKNSLAQNAKINFFLDSKLVCSQIIGLFKVKNVGLKDLLLDVRDREGQICLPMFYKHIPREQNTKADAFVNMALDSNADVSS